MGAGLGWAGFPESPAQPILTPSPGNPALFSIQHPDDLGLRSPAPPSAPPSCSGGLSDPSPPRVGRLAVFPCTPGEVHHLQGMQQACNRATEQREGEWRGRSLPRGGVPLPLLPLIPLLPLLLRLPLHRGRRRAGGSGCHSRTHAGGMQTARCPVVTSPPHRRR